MTEANSRTLDKRYAVAKASGSRYAYVLDSLGHRPPERFAILKGDGWTRAERVNQGAFMIEYSNPPPDVAERYITANQSSNLKCDTREDAPIGSTGILIAAGWSPSRIGAALMRLHTKPDRDGIEQVHGQIARQAAYWGIERPEAVAASALAWWLSHVCDKCHGVRFELVAGTPALSNRHCKTCRGSGEVAIPHGSAGQRLTAWMDHCHERGAQSIKARLHNIRK